MLLQLPGDWVTVLNVVAQFPPVPALGFRGRTFLWDRDGDSEMANYLCKMGLLAFLPPPAPVLITATTRLSRWTPLCSFTDGLILMPSVGFLGPMLLAFFHLVSTCGNFLVILVKWRSPPVSTR